MAGAASARNERKKKEKSSPLRQQQKKISLSIQNNPSYDYLMSITS
jgi:hypothetical protein